MQKTETSWTNNGEWKARYSKLYSSQRISMSQNDEPSRISFMSNDTTPYTSLLMRMRSSRRSSAGSDQLTPEYFSSLLSQRSDPYGSFRSNVRTDDLGGHETKLLDMVRAHSRDLQDEILDQPLDIPGHETVDDQSTETCVHVLSIRATERSVSRSRVSRMSTRRDMDIPSILAFTTSTPAPVQLEIPAFQNMNKAKPQKEIPRWSIRRSLCPVCSQKWKDKSAISNIKYSGLKRNSSSELPSVMAPARLRASITMAYVPRPALPVVDEDTPGHGVMRNTSATWQLTRARKFRAPKPLQPPPEATAPPSAAAPLAQKDLDIRVNKFLKDEI